MPPSAKSPPNRIAELRKAHKFTQADLGDALGGVHWTTISELERGRQALTEKWMRRIAEIFDISPAALLNGEAEAHRSTPLAGKIGPAGIVTKFPIDENEVSDVDFPFAVPPDAISFIVSGDAMLPRYGNGDVLIALENSRRPMDTYLNEEAFVRLTDGTTYLRTLSHIRRNGNCSLELFNSKTIEDVEAVWIGQVFAVVRASQFDFQKRAQEMRAAGLGAKDRNKHDPRQPILTNFPEQGSK